MAMGCGTTILKYLLFLFNIIFFVCGAAILGVSIWLVVDETASDYLHLVSNASGNDTLTYAMYGMIAVGAFIFFVGFLGCCGACTESACMLSMYSCLVLLIFVAQIAAAVVAILYKEEIENELQDHLSKQVNEEITNIAEDATSLAWFTLQYENQCCGSYNYTDYENSKWVTETGTDVPMTCCKLSNSDPKNPEPVDYDTCQAEARDKVTSPTQLHSQGCYETLIDWINANTDILIGVALGLAAFQIFCIIFACCVRSAIDEKY